MGLITDILKGMPVNAVLQEKIQGLEKKYEELEAENARLKDENRELKSKLEGLTSSDELCENEVKILTLLSLHNQEFTAEQIARELSLNLTKTEYYLEKMWKKQVYSHDYSNERPSEYYLAQGRREYLVMNDLI